VAGRAETRGSRRRRRPASRSGLSGELVGGGALHTPLTVDAGDEELRPRSTQFDPRGGALDLPDRAPRERVSELALGELRELLPRTEPGRELDDWGRSQRFFDLVRPALDFYYRYWFRVEQRGIGNVPSEGGSLLVSNHSGALPPDAPMIMQAIHHEHPSPRPVYMLGEHWFRGFPGVGMAANKMGLVPAHPANAQRLLRDEQRLVLVFPEGQKASRKVFWQRYRLRRFGRGGFVRTAILARVPIVPIAVVGAEEAMPIFAHVPALQRLTGLLYFPINHAFPHFGFAAAAMYLPAKFKISFLEPLDLSEYERDDADDVSLVQSIAEEIRVRIQAELDRLLASRRSVWLG
jgi:1-acyl-sn-glycerol-3-phosphate acyltransferase